MKKITILLIFFVCAKFVDAQYTYITDRRFFEPTDLIGYDFKPDRIEIPNEMEDELEPGDYSFGISTNNLYVVGEGIKGVYNINNFAPENYGYKLTLMNARDALLQGHLKIILNKYAMVELLIFKRSPKEKEIIFYLPPISKKLQQQERAYFTDRGELAIAEPDSLWGKTIYPFLRIYTDKKVQQPLSMGDSTSISFIEEVTIEEKIKKTKASKKKKKELETEVAEMTETPEEVVEEMIEETVEEVSEEVAVEETAEGVEKKVKITKTYYVVLKSIIQYDDATTEDKTWKFEVKNVKSKADESAKMDEEKFQWEFVTAKGETIYMYLNGDNTVSTMEIGNERFLMRGF